MCVFFPSFQRFWNAIEGELKLLSKARKEEREKNQTNPYKKYKREKCNSTSVIRSVLWKYILVLNNVKRAHNSKRKEAYINSLYKKTKKKKKKKKENTRRLLKQQRNSNE